VGFLALKCPSGIWHFTFFTSARALGISSDGKTASPLFCLLFIAAKPPIYFIESIDSEREHAILMLEP